MRVWISLLSAIALLHPFTSGLYASSAKANNDTQLTFGIEFTKEDLVFRQVEGYDLISLSDNLFTREANQPQLPIEVVHIALEPDTIISRIELIHDVSEVIPGEYQIMPTRGSVFINAEGEFPVEGAPASGFGTAYPEGRVQLKAEGSLSGMHIATLHVYPLEYIPARKQLILHRSIKFRLTLEEEPHTVGGKGALLNQTTRDMLKALVINPEKVDAAFNEAPSPTETIDYLIITNQALIYSHVFQPLLDSKSERGLSVSIRSVEDIKANFPGRDIQERVRNFIIEMHQQHGVAWVLLGGDTNIIPPRLAEPGEGESEVISDLYYSDLDGDWDADGDGIFGEPEDEVDLYPDVFVGRAPVENEDEGRAFVNKVLTYEANISGYAGTALFLGAEDYFDAGGGAKDLIDQMYMPAEFDPITKFYERDIPCYRDRTIAAINEGVHFVNHIDHSGGDSLRTGCDGLSTLDIDHLSNAFAPSILWSVGCSVAEIDADSIAEHWITNPHGGGVAALGNSRGSHSPEADQMLDPEFYKSLFTDGFTHIGQTLADSKITFIGEASTNPAMRHDLMGLNLLGDPEMNIQTPSQASATLLPPPADPERSEPMEAENTLAIQSHPAGAQSANGIEDVLYSSTELTTTDRKGGDWFGFSAAISGDYAVVGVPLDDEPEDASGSAYVFQREGDGWAYQTKLTPADNAAEDWFGTSVSISGDSIIVSNLRDDDNGNESGSVYIFEQVESVWSQQNKLTASDGIPDNWFGYAVSISGDYAIAGTPYDDDVGKSAGAAYIFKRDSDNWTEQAKLIASDGTDYDFFGCSVAIAGDYAIIGARGDDDLGVYSGSAYIFRREGDNWIEEEKLLPIDGEINNEFGSSVAISSNYALVGARSDDDLGEMSGSAYVFKHEADSWIQQEKLTASDGDLLHSFGYSVSLDGDYAIVGARGAESFIVRAGTAYVYKRIGEDWIEQNELIPPNLGRYGDRFGQAVSISDHDVIVGAYRNDKFGAEAGTAYIFHLIPIAPESLVLAGPTAGMTGVSIPFTATVESTRTTLPITYTWQAAGSDAITHRGNLSDTMTFDWNEAGPQTISVTITNESEIPLTATHVITLEADTPPLYFSYLPTVFNQTDNTAYPPDYNSEGLSMPSGDRRRK